MSVKENCAFYRKEKEDCSILLRLYCKNCEKCNFYKTEKQENADRRKYGYNLIEE